MYVDRISTLPQPILETILCSLDTTEEAARTSILSREWRYKWTTIPELWFTLGERTSELTFDTASSIKYMNDVHQVLLRHQGRIHVFSLHMSDFWEHYDYIELDQILLHLSRNHTVKKLTLDGLDESEQKMWYGLPESVFTLRHLTDLYLCTFEIDHPSIFSGFGSLESLNLSDVKISTQTLLHVLSNCPSLKKLSLNIDAPGDTCAVSELLKCLPMIEDLAMSGDVSEWLFPDLVPQKLPTLLIHLKYLSLVGMCLVEGYGLALLLALIKCSPNLKHAHLEIEWGLEEFCAVKDEYSDVWLKHLNELDVCFCGRWLDTEFVKFILARSPKLKKLTIFTLLDRKQESEMLLMLRRVPRACPGVIITSFRL